MSLLFHQSQSPTPFYANPISGSDLNAAALAESREQIDLHHADMEFSNWCFDGFRLAFNKLEQRQATSYEVSNSIDAIKIYFNKRGRMNIHYRELSKKFTIGSGEFNMLYAGQLNSELFHIDDHSEIFSLQLTKECFYSLIDEGCLQPGEFADQIAGNHAALYSARWQRMDLRMEHCIDQIIHCKYSPALKKIYLRSKAMELLVLMADAFSKTPAITNTIKNTDKEKLFYAREFLQHHYAEDISIASLARTCGLNEFKLKKGFRELFNTSVVDFLINHRLEQAHQQLRNSSGSIQEIAYQTGYSSPEYFSRAFKKKYGINPATLGKS